LTPRYLTSEFSENQPLREEFLLLVLWINNFAFIQKTFWICSEDALVINHWRIKVIDQKNIEHIAKLAKLRISEDEAKQYAAQLSKSLEYFDQISQVDVTGVEPMVTPSDIEVFLRDDQVVKTVSSEDLVANAPERLGHLFKVPPVV
jgi:aspartyl-tRNA(Asn)/glutamyl-tRNA(Gln) amidotransferase subunit C